MKTWLAFVCFLMFAGCGEDGPETPVTLASLPAADRAAFEAWKGHVIKDCAWQQAFPSLDAEFPGPAYQPASRVDVAQLLAANNGTRLITGPAGQLALLGPTPLGVGSARDERTAHHQGSGENRSLEVSAELEGNTCVIRLAGEEVFRAELPSSVPVVASYDPAAPTTAIANLPALIDGSPGTDAVAALATGPLVLPVTTALAPANRVFGWLAARWAIDGAVAQAVFPLGGPRSPSVVRLSALADTTPFAPLEPVFGPRASLATLYAGGPAQLELLFDGLDDDLIALHAELAIDAGGQGVKLRSIAAAPAIAHDDAAMRACYTARGVASRFEPAGPRSPAFALLFASCAPLARDGYAALAADPAIRQAIAVKALGNDATPRAYRGWDLAVIAVAQRLAAQGLPLTALDPASTLPALAPIVARESALRGAIEDAAAQHALEPALIALTFGWWFDALAPSTALVADLGSALHNAASGYLASVETMLSDLRASVAAGSAGVEAVACGVGLTDSRRGELDGVIGRLAAVPHGAGFASELHDAVLQRCPSSSALAALDHAAAATSAFITADAVRAAASPGFGAAADELVAHALGEAWSKTTFDALTDVVGFDVLANPSCAAYTARAEQATCVDAELTRLSANGEGILAPDVAGRYVAAARELEGRWGKLDERFGSTQLDLASAWARGLWRGCSNDGFARAMAQLTKLLDRLVVSSDLGGFDLASQIATLVDEETCS